MVERHTNQDSLGWVVTFTGTRLPIGEDYGVHVEPNYGHPAYDYTYGASKLALRPVVEDEDRSIPVSLPRKTRSDKGRPRDPYKKKGTPHYESERRNRSRQQGYPISEPVIQSTHVVTRRTRHDVSRYDTTPVPDRVSVSRNDPRLTLADLENSGLDTQ